MSFPSFFFFTASPISTPIPVIKLETFSLQRVNHTFKRQVLATETLFFSSIYSKHWSIRKRKREFRFRVCCNLENSDDKGVAEDDDDDVIEKEGHTQELEKPVGRLREAINSVTPVVFVLKKQMCTNTSAGLCVAVALVVISIRAYLIQKSRSNHRGSVSDLVKRGQLRSDRRGISRPLRYDDPFDNPLVKVSKSNSTVEMCGKVYRLAPVTLTQVEQSNHQRRRSRAYQWKRPTIFLKEGESVPPNVDPDTVRWIPANHPFATTVNDIDEELAQSNVYQKTGVPSRIKAEHEALQRKLETLQSDQELNKVAIDPRNVRRDFERPFKSSSREHADQRSSGNQGGYSSTPKLDKGDNSSETNTSFGEQQQKP